MIHVGLAVAVAISIDWEVIQDLGLEEAVVAWLFG